MRVILAFMLLCGISAAADTPEQQDQDYGRAFLLMDYGEWKSAMVIGDHLEEQGSPHAAHIRDTFNKHAPPHEKEYEETRLRIKEQSKRGREDMRREAQLGDKRFAKILEVSEQSIAQNLANQLAEAREMASLIEAGIEASKAKERENEAKRREYETAQYQDRSEQRRDVYTPQPQSKETREADKAKRPPERSSKPFGKIKREAWMAVKEDHERFGWYTLTLDIGSWGDEPKDMNFHVSYNVDPRSVGDVEDTILGILTHVSTELQKRGYDVDEDDIPLRARAFKVVSDRVYPFGMGRWIPSHATYEFSQFWWEFGEGE